jgi:hypothetical protein
VVLCIEVSVRNMSGYLAWLECNMSGSLDRRECT